MTRRPNPAIHAYCRACFGWGSTTVRKSTDYEDEIECLDCDGTGIRARNSEMTETVTT